MGEPGAGGAGPGRATASAESPARAAGFDPWSAAFVAAPYPAYSRLRAHAPVTYFPPTDQWLISRYAEVNALLRDRRLGRTYLHVATHAEMGRPDDPPHLAAFWRLIRDGMLDREPPDHTRLRRLVSRAFTPRRVDSLRPRVEAVAASLVDDLLDAGSDGSVVDLKSVVAEPLPVAVIAELLGIPEPDRPLLRPWSADICRMYELNPTPDAERAAVRASVEFSGYLRELARSRRRRPGEDLISALAQLVGGDASSGDGPRPAGAPRPVHGPGERLSEDELVGTCVLLLNAGHEATVNVTGNGWLALFNHPQELARLRADPAGLPALLPAAVEELLRFDTPLQMFERWVLEDIRVPAGEETVTIPRGSEVALLFGSANRDPARFPDPDRLDLGRADNAHVSFGAGIHFCLGAALARLELVASYAAVLRRVPRLSLAAEPCWAPGYIIRGLESLPVTVR